MCAAISVNFVARADVKMPAVFSDNMVLQQQTQVLVRGWAKAGATVTVTGSWNGKSYSTKSDANGAWKLKVQTPAASFTPCSLTISDGKAVTLKNVMIGEVWICSGQSNMEMPMKGFGDQPIAGGPEAIAESSNPAIRCFTVKRASTVTPRDDCGGTWQEANPLTTPEFTATGYYFGRLLQKSLNVPVGLINVSWGGSRIEAWMPPKSFAEFPDKQLPATDADIKSQNGSPAVLYNGMLNPLIGYGMRGAIWYQGEANKDEPELYVKMFDKMVRGWREVWDAGEFPFYYCQLAPFDYGKVNSAYMREAQSKGLLTPNTGMAVLADAESPFCIHPPKKKSAGERLALWALAKTYGMDRMHYRSPEYKSMTVEGRMVVVEFEMFGSTSGLTTHDASGAPSGYYPAEKQLMNFTVAGENKRFHKATAILYKSKVYLFSPAVANPVAVRYCFESTSAAELFSVEGDLPVSSFRTDSFEL
jgi:sialate O-acetylesterase